MQSLSYVEQYNQYNLNLKSLSNILNITKSEIKCMAHPLGSYNKDTIKILNDLGIELGFKQMLSVEKEKGMKKINNSFLEIAREDHSNIITKMY